MRFTPMHMGTTPRSDARSRAFGSVHPHAHGDNASAHGMPLSHAGSPPCTWGQRRTAQAGRATTRFTPMHMGTTGGSDRRRVDCDGSPPCTWGQLRLPILPMRQPPRFTPMHMGTTVDRSARLRRDRFTPMHMGTTQRPLAQRRNLPVHPHAHGDNETGCGLDLGDRFTPMHMGTTR